MMNQFIAGSDSHPLSGITATKSPETKEETIDYMKSLVDRGYAESSIGDLIVRRVEPCLAWIAFEAAQEALKESRAKQGVSK